MEPTVEDSNSNEPMSPPADPEEITASSTVIFKPAPSPDAPDSQILNLDPIDEQESTNIFQETPHNFLSPADVPSVNLSRSDSLDTSEDLNSDNSPKRPLLDLPPVDSLQPDELCICIQDTITKMSVLDPVQDSRLIFAYRHNLIKQLEKLQKVKWFILQNMYILIPNMFIKYVHFHFLSLYFPI